MYTCGDSWAASSGFDLWARSPQGQLIRKTNVDRFRRFDDILSSQGLEGYFRDSGFGQNTMRESGKKDILIRDLTVPRETGVAKHWAQDVGLMFACRSGMPETVTNHLFKWPNQINQAGAKWCVLSNKKPYRVSG